jgi:hypothetical protein
MIILLLILIFIISLLFYNIENFNNDNTNNDNTHNDDNNTYLNKAELYEILINNSDNYYNTFNDYDFKVRNIKTIQDYYINIQNSVSEINNYNKNNIDIIINNVNNKLKSINIIGFDGIKASQIPWIIGIINGINYEYGLPHTRNNIIIIPIKLVNNKVLERILFHEKIHIYQKLYPNDINNYLINNNFKKYCSRNNFNNIRANPDIDDWVYINITDNIMIAKYIDNPQTINDVIYYPFNSYNYEHPYEFMAYQLENMFFK